MAHARVALYRMTAGTADEIGQRVQEGMVPILRDQDGFVSYHVVSAGDTLISVSRWDTQDQAEQAVQTIADWVRDSGVDQMVERTQNYVGEIIVSA
jgi:heme-degrading monooxygenase HmoA